jgi:GNAT superfamily N-acetyltransferase
MRVVEVEVGRTYDLRRRVLLVPPRPVSLAGDEQDDTFHLGAEDGDALVAVGTFVPGPSGVQVRGMAVDPDRQGTGAGRLIIEAAVERLRDAGVTRLWCNARDTAVGFYEALGFTASGPGFFHAESGLPHTPMERKL